MIYEKNTETGEVDADCHWWVQAETVVGYINLYEYFNNEDALEKALQCWNFIKKHLIDSKNGEWFWSLKADGTINTADDKAGFWKCPYHNGRMCMQSKLKLHCSFSKLDTTARLMLMYYVDFIAFLEK